MEKWETAKWEIGEMGNWRNGKMTKQEMAKWENDENDETGNGEMGRHQMLGAPAARGPRNKGCYFWSPLYIIG
jgi:hypothetical protein